MHFDALQQEAYGLFKSGSALQSPTIPKISSGIDSIGALRSVLPQATAAGVPADKISSLTDSLNLYDSTLNGLNAHTIESLRDFPLATSKVNTAMQVKRAVDTAHGTLCDNIGEAFGVILGLLDEALAKATEALDAVISAISSGLSVIGDYIDAAIAAISSAIKEIIDQLALEVGIMEEVREILEAFAKAASMLAQILTDPCVIGMVGVLGTPALKSTLNKSSKIIKQIM